MYKHRFYIRCTEQWVIDMLHLWCCGNGILFNNLEVFVKLRSEAEDRYILTMLGPICIGGLPIFSLFKLDISLSWFKKDNDTVCTKSVKKRSGGDFFGFFVFKIFKRLELPCFYL